MLNISENIMYNHAKKKIVKILRTNQMPRSSTGPKIFWAGPNLLCQTKNSLNYCASQRQYQSFCNRPKDDLHFVNSVFVPTQNFL
jgi:hypothetical protein